MITAFLIICGWIWNYYGSKNDIASMSLARRRYMALATKVGNTQIVTALCGAIFETLTRGDYCNGEIIISESWEEAERTHREQVLYVEGLYQAAVAHQPEPEIHRPDPKLPKRCIQVEEK
jgi:hypothetical protein